MPRDHWPRIVLVLGLAAALGTLPVWGEPQTAAEGRSAQLAVANTFGKLWSLLTELWGEAGCILDPHGGCAAGSAPLAEEGCILDPHGGCEAGSRGSFAEAGCILDPHGCPGGQSTPVADAGCGLDPHGGCSR